MAALARGVLPFKELEVSKCYEFKQIKGAAIGKQKELLSPLTVKKQKLFLNKQSKAKQWRYVLHSYGYSNMIISRHGVYLFIKQLM